MPFETHTLELVGIGLFLALQLAIGSWLYERNRSESDYFIASRALGLGLSTFTIFATWFGAETCLSSAGRIYESGLAGGRADPFGYTLCLVAMGLCFAARIWKCQFITLPELFRDRFSVATERAAALLMIPTSILWAAAQIRGFGQVLSVSTELGAVVATCIAAAIVIAYTSLGGFLADVYTDLVQGIVLMLGLAVLLVVVVGDLGGAGAAWASIDAARLSPFGAQATDDSIWTRLDGWAVPILGSLVAQELIARVLAARSLEVARRSLFLGGGLYLVVGMIPALLGLLGPALISGLDDSEQLLPRLAQERLGAVGYVLFCGAIVSAILSTVDSALLACASLFSRNLAAPWLAGRDDAAKVKLARFAVVGFGLVSCGLAIGAEGVYELVQAASAYGSSGLLVAMGFALFGRFGGPAAALAALATGLVSMLAAEQWLDLSAPYLFSLAASFAAYVAAEALARAIAAASGPGAAAAGA